MKIPIKKLKSGFSMPVFGFGTWMMGGNHRRNTDYDREEIESIRNAIDCGITHIDTAEMYGDGHAEELVGEAIKDYKREKLFLESKVWKSNLGYNNVLRAIDGSLKRLKTDYLDLYLIHMPNPDIPIEETIKAMDRLKEEGLIKNIGVSDFTVERFSKSQASSRYKIVANQLHYNLIFREPEKKGLVEFCQDNDVMLIAWRPVQKGLLAESKVSIMTTMCDKYRKTPAQIAINWLISQKNIVTLSKMTSLEHLKENLGSLGWIMDKDDVERLRKEFPGQKDVSNAVPLI